MKGKLLIFILFLLPLSAGAQKLSWQEFNSIRGKYSCSLPGKPSETVEEKENITNYKITFEVDSLIFMIQSTIHVIEMEDPKGMAEIALGAFTKALGGEKNSGSTWKVSGHEGLKSQIFMKAANKYAEYAVVLAGKYQIQAIVLHSNTKAHKKMVKKFYKKFALTVEK